MPEISCRLIFYDFTENFIDKFVNLIQNFHFQTLHELITQPAVSLDSEKNAEVQFSFQLSATAPEGQKLEKSEKYRQTCLALCELTTTFERYRYELCGQGLSHSATVTMTILSKNIYPQHFELQNVFSMEKFLFGTINNRRNFAPTYFFNEPTNFQNESEIFRQYLDEQRDLQDIGSNMLICFEHDRQYLTICFPNIIKNNNPNDENNRTHNRVVDIRVSYSSIRRVIAAMSSAAGDNEEIRISFTFQLNYPPAIQIYDMFSGGGAEGGGNRNAGSKTKFKKPHRFLTWNPGHDILNSVAMGSCLVADCRFADPRSLLDCLDRLRKSNHYSIEFRVLYRKKCLHIKNYECNKFMNPENLPQEYSKLKDLKYFPLVYAVQALITRGGEIYDYFFRPEYGKFNEFLDTVIQHFDEDLCKDPEARIVKTVITLENMLLEIDKEHDVIEPLMLFEKLYNDSSHRIAAEITDDLANEGYMRVRKININNTNEKNVY
uniref:Uncharacterized protein n=1 Tax=Panagrolaimus sp. ES5 TaxID=591445 RepID=A0AC34G4H3_9BILA